MARLQDILLDHGIDPELFLKFAGTEEARRFRSSPDDNVKSDPGLYVLSAFSWSETRHPPVAWIDVDMAWESSGPQERWLDLEAALGWLDPMECELRRVGHVGVGGE